MMTACPVKKGYLAGLLLAGAVTATLYLSWHPSTLPTHMPTEMGKLFQILNIYQSGDYKVIYNGDTYETGAAISHAKKFIAAHYHGEDTQAWVRNHLYRSPDKGSIIYLTFPDGSRRPIADVLIEDLNRSPGKQK